MTRGKQGVLTRNVGNVRNATTHAVTRISRNLPCHDKQLQVAFQQTTAWSEHEYMYSWRWNILAYACFKLIIPVVNVIKHFCYTFVVPVKNCANTKRLPPYILN